MNLPTPDIIAIKDNKFYAIECKSRVNKYLYISEVQLNDLKSWEDSGAHTIIAFKKKKWYFFKISDLQQKKKSLGLNLEKIKDLEKHNIEEYFP